jgi:ATP-dependent DNA ligase
MPFVSLPKKHRSRYGEGLTAGDMKKCVWERPELVAQIEFLEWTESDHLPSLRLLSLSNYEVVLEQRQQHAALVTSRNDPQTNRKRSL